MIQKLEQSEHTPESHLDQSLSYSNGHQSADKFNNDFDPHEALALVTTLKTDLQKRGYLAKPETYEKLLRLEKWVQDLPKESKVDLGVDTEEYFKRERQLLLTLGSKMRQAATIEALFKATVTQVRQHLQADRVLIYRFESVNQGVVLAESMGTGYTPSYGEKLPAIAFGAETDLDYPQQAGIALNDIYHGTLNSYQIQLLERFQVKASLSLPIQLQDQVWGLLVVQQCSSSRAWQEAEINLLYQIVTELRLALQPAEFRNQRQEQAKQELVLAQILEETQPSSDTNTALGNLCQSLRRSYRADRVVFYRFLPDWSGEFVAESVAAGWVGVVKEQEQDASLTSAYRITYDRCTIKTAGSPATPDLTDTALQDTQGGSYFKSRQIKRIDDIYNAGFADCYIASLEKYQAKAYIIAPIFNGNQLWGLLGVYQNSGPRNWQDSEVILLSLVSDRLSSILKQLDFLAQLNVKSEALAKEVEQERSLTRVTDKIRQTLDIEKIFSVTTQEIRRLLSVERVTIYKFRPDYFGDFVYETHSGDWPKLVGSGWEDPYLSENQGGRFRDNEPLVVDDVYNGGLTDCHVEALEYFGVKSCAVVSIFQGQKLWGLLSAFQHSGSRHWEESEVKLLRQVGSQLGLAIQQAEYLKQIQAQTEQQTKEAERERSLAKVVDRIRQTYEIEKIFETATHEVRRLLNVERVTIYKFRDDYFGDFVYESEPGDWPKLVGSGWEDPYLNEHRGGRFRDNKSLVVDDVYNGELTDCHVEALEYFGVKSCAVVAIFQGQKLWGLLSAFQHSGPRHWDKGEVRLLTQVGTQLGLAIQQAEYLKQIQSQTKQQAKEAERERSLAKVVDRIRQTYDIEKIFSVTTQEIRRLLNVERVTIYKFRPDYFGDFVYESESGNWPKLVGSGWEDPYLNENQGGRFRDNKPLVVDDVYNGELTDCHVEALEYFGVKSCAVVAIFQGQKLWGLLSAFHHSGPRHWEEGEVRLLTQIGAQVGLALQQAEYLKQLQAQSAQLTKTAELERAATQIITNVRQSMDLEQIFQTTCTEIRQLLDADRVGVFRFDPNSGFNHGKMVSESVVSGYTSALAVNIDDHCFGEKYAEIYRKGRVWAITDIQNAQLAECYVSTLSQLQVRANLIAPVMQGTELWGLLCIHQCRGPRHWQKHETEFAKQVAYQLSIALQQAQYVNQLQEQSSQLAKAAEREKAVAKITTKILQSLNEATIFQITTQEVRLMLKCDRTAIYRFEPDWSGTFIAESVAKGWVPLVNGDIKTVWADTYLQETQGGRYRHKESFAVDDIYTIGHSPCHVEILEQFEIRAYILAPIFIQDKLWGILCAYQNTGPRQWEQSEILALEQIGLQVSAALQLVNYVDQVQQKSAQLAKLVERETNFINLIYKTGNRITERLQQGTLNTDSFLRTTTQELRQLLKVDRVAVYRFSPDWSGEFVIEDVGSTYKGLIGTEAAQVADPILQETKGGQYSKNEASVVNDITEVENLTFSKALLEDWGAKAYVIAPLFKGDQLWGLLATYQNTESRHWEEGEVNFLVQMARQLGIVLQQVESLEQIETQSQQLHQAAQREKADKEALQYGVVRLLSAVRPALGGDLTVRAPVTEDEVGTVADAYNNTLQSLRKIIKQVQESSRKVAQTSQESDISLVGLTAQAQQQFQALERALGQIQTMAEFTEAVGSSAQQVDVAVQLANQTVHEGDEAMNRTVDGILEIRETVAETSKRLKRLAESSQKVSRVVNLISNFTTQTQLLALNAAIEATRAGEYGRGFVVVADEVRSLARQSAEATTEIAQLVQEIQAGTAEVSTVMEKGIQQVAQGTNLVTDARQTLNAIVEATTQISELVEGITQATQLQTKEFRVVKQTMSDVAAISNQTSEDAIEISTTFKELLAMAQNLQASADQFKVD
jgi:methyl-accepting chemotaxis protein PixJ